MQHPSDQTGHLWTIDSMLQLITNLVSVNLSFFRAIVVFRVIESHQLEHHHPDSMDLCLVYIFSWNWAHLAEIV